MTCAEAKEILPGLVDAALSEGEVRDLEAHVAACPRCQAELSALKKSAVLVDGVAEVEPPPFFAKKVMAQVRAAAEPEPGLLQKTFFPLHVKLPLEALAAVLVAVIGVQIYRSIGPESLRPSDMEPPRVTQRAPSNETAENKAEVVTVDSKPAEEKPTENVDRKPPSEEPKRLAKEKAAPRRDRVFEEADKEGFAAWPPAKKASQLPAESSGTGLVFENKKDRFGEAPATGKAESRPADGRAGAGAAARKDLDSEFKRAKKEDDAAKPGGPARDQPGYAESPPPPPAPKAATERPAPRKLEAVPAEPAPSPSAGLGREMSADEAADRPWLEESKQAERETRAKTEQQRSAARPRFASPSAAGPPVAGPSVGGAGAAPSAPAAAEPETEDKAGKKAQTEKAAPRVVTVRAGDRARAGEKLVGLLPSVGARLTRKQVRSDRDIFFVEVAASDLRALLEKLKDLGTVSSGSLDAGTDETTVVVRVDVIQVAP